MSSASQRFKKWLAGIRKEEPQPEPVKRPSKAPTRPVRRLKRAKVAPATSRRKTPQKPPVSMHEMSDGVVHVVFNQALERLRNPPPVPEPHQFVVRRDPITRKFKKIDKKDIGGVSSVFYYNNKGKLIGDD